MLSGPVLSCYWEAGEVVAASSEHIGGSMDFALPLLMRDMLLTHCYTAPVSPVVDYHMWYKGEKYQLICRMDGS